MEPFDDGCRLKPEEVGHHDKWGRGKAMGEGDKIKLSVRERQQLAAIQAMVESEDPGLAKTLTGRRATVEVALRRGSHVAVEWVKICSNKVWLGPVLFVLGFTLIFTMIAMLAWVSILGAAMVACGLGLSVHTWQARRDKGAPRRPVDQNVSD